MDTDRQLDLMLKLLVIEAMPVRVRREVQEGHDAVAPADPRKSVRATARGK